jgi:hypothetical protein
MVRPLILIINFNTLMKAIGRMINDQARVPRRLNLPHIKGNSSRIRSKEMAL